MAIVSTLILVVTGCGQGGTKRSAPGREEDGKDKSHENKPVLLVYLPGTSPTPPVGANSSPGGGNQGGLSGGPTGAAANPAGGGAGSSPPASAAGQQPSGLTNPCELLTKAEITAVVGVEVTDPKGPTEKTSFGVQGMRDCRYDSTSQARSVFVTVGLVASSGRAAFDAYKANPSYREKLTPVSNVGQEAVWFIISPQLGLGHLIALKNDKVIGIGLLEPAQKDYLPPSTQLADRAVGRI